MVASRLAGFARQAQVRVACALCLQLPSCSSQVQPCVHRCSAAQPTMSALSFLDIHAACLHASCLAQAGSTSGPTACRFKDQVMGGKTVMNMSCISEQTQEAASWSSCKSLALLGEP